MAAVTESECLGGEMLGAAASFLVPPTPTSPEAKKLAWMCDRWRGPALPYVCCSPFLGTQLPDTDLASRAAASRGVSRAVAPSVVQCFLCFSFVDAPSLAPWVSPGAEGAVWFLTGTSAAHNRWQVAEAHPEVGRSLLAALLPGTREEGVKSEQRAQAGAFLFLYDPEPREEGREIKNSSICPHWNRALFTSALVWSALYASVG